jgi:cytochrome c biogenesis protein CcmG/thiol:disulfide interchange protein DsbE
MVSRRVPLPVLVGATVLVVAAVAVVLTRSNSGSDDGAPSSDEVRAVELDALGAGEPGRLGDLLDGRPLVVNFFAEWCAPCRREMPDFERVHQELGDEVGVVGIATSSRKPDEAVELVADTGITYPTYADPSGEVLALFEGLQMPTTVFVAADGTVLETHLTRLDADQLRAKIAENFDVGRA